MSRNPYAKSRRAKPQQVIGDKREKTFREHLKDTESEGVPEWAQALLAKLK